MKIQVKDLSFGYSETLLFNNFNAEFESSDRPLVILGPSGSGKTTLLKLLGGLLIPQSGKITFDTPASAAVADRIAFMFQETRLLPWLTILENIAIPLEKDFGKEEAKKRAEHFLSLVSLEDKVNAYPAIISGGQAQRVSMARAFAWPAPALFMDEPFQSLDIPLRISLMELTLSLLKKEKRLLIIVCHDPREAIFLGQRVVILGKPGEGIVYDEIIDLNAEERVFGSGAAVKLEREMISFMGHGS